MSQPPSHLFEPIRRNLIRIFMLLAVSDEPMTGKALAKELEVSISSLEIYMRAVKSSEFIKGVRGSLGGYTLAADPKDITIIDIIGKTILIEQDIFSIEMLVERTVDFLDNITLQNLLDWDE